MKLAELLYRAACLRATEKRRKEGRIADLTTLRESGRIYKKRVNGLVCIPNKIRKRFGSAPR